MGAGRLPGLEHEPLAQDTQGFATSPGNNASAAVAVLTDGLSQATTFTLDSAGRLLKLQTPDGATQSWVRDFDGQVTGATDGLGRTTTYTYQYGAGLGDLTQVTFADGSSE